MPPKVDRQVNKFFARYRIQKFDKGEILIFAGEKPKGVFLLLEGTIRQYDISKRGSEMVVKIYDPPAIFPMNYAINHLPNEYFFAAASPIAVRQAPEQEVLEFVRNNAEVALVLLSGAYQGMDGAMRRQMLLMGSGSAERLVYEIIEMCRRLGNRLSDGSIELYMNETELATQVGLARETVSRQLQVLKEKKLVRVLPHIMVIRDLRALESYMHGGAHFSES